MPLIQRILTSAAKDARSSVIRPASEAVVMTQRLDRLKADEERFHKEISIDAEDARTRLKHETEMAALNRITNRKKQELNTDLELKRQSLVKRKIAWGIGDDWASEYGSECGSHSHTSGNRRSLYGSEMSGARSDAMSDISSVVAKSEREVQLERELLLERELEFLREKKLELEVERQREKVDAEMFHEREKVEADIVKIKQRVHFLSLKPVTEVDGEKFEDDADATMVGDEEEDELEAEMARISKRKTELEEEQRQKKLAVEEARIKKLAEEELAKKRAAEEEERRMKEAVDREVRRIEEQAKQNILNSRRISIFFSITPEGAWVNEVMS